MYLLDPQLGMITHYLIKLGILSGPFYWASDPVWAKWIITLVASWTFWPFMFLIILSSLQTIPNSYYELAEVYGANMWQAFLDRHAAPYPGRTGNSGDHTHCLEPGQD